MVENLNAEIISIGTEILLGELTDTNSVYIARTFRDLGINVYFMTSVGDNIQRIESAIRIALSRADVVITCGGLGPTVDDMTREAIAAATNRGLTFHQSLLDTIAERFKGYRATMTENNKRQAYLPDDAVLIENPVGTAPSFAVEHEGKVVISLPGVPREMKFLLKEKVIPYLLSKYTLGIIKARILKAAGIGESSLDDLIGADLLEKSNPTIGLAAHQGQVDIRITAKADTEDIADAMIAEMETSVRERAGEFIFGTDEETLESVFVAMLKAQGAKVGIVQAGIGAVLSDGLRTVDGGDDIIALVENYGDPAMLRRQYDLSADLTLREAGREIAKHVYENNDVALSIVIASLPDIDEGEDQSESTVITVYTPDETAERVYGFGGRSSLVREWLPRWALSRAWRMLQAKADA